MITLSIRNRIRRITLILLLSIPMSVWGQEANEIIVKYFNEVSNGNVANWSKIKSVYIESIASYSQQDFEKNLRILI